MQLQDIYTEGVAWEEEEEEEDEEEEKEKEKTEEN